MEMVYNQQTKALAFFPSLGIQEMVGLETPSPQTIFQQQLRGNRLNMLSNPVVKKLLMSHQNQKLLIKTKLMQAGTPGFFFQQ